MPHTPTKRPSAPPPWYCTQGDTMRVGTPGTPLTPQCDLYLHDGVVAQVAIAQVGRRDKYVLDWQVIHEGGLDNAHTRGRIEATAAELRAMFCLDDTMNDETSLWLIERYSGTTASQGKFIRFGHYLNIPGPGTGHEGDANISVFVSDEIRDAVGRLLAKRNQASAA